MDQFRDLMERKVQINLDQQPLMHEKERVQAQINEFEEKRQGIKVSHCSVKVR